MPGLASTTSCTRRARSPPTEVARALDAGALLVKLFLAGVHGPRYARELRAPFLQARLVQTGGVTPANASEYLDAGAAAVAVGSALVDDAAVGDVELVHARARSLRGALALPRTA